MHGPEQWPCIRSHGLPQVDEVGKDLGKGGRKMGLFDGLVEGMLQGATLGLSDKIGITGKGGVVHDGDDDPGRDGDDRGDRGRRRLIRKTGVRRGSAAHSFC